MNSYEKRGYLDRDFRLFRLKGPTEEPVGYHYHDFHKILILQKGRLNYLIEGRSCHLHPHDIVLVGRHTVHRPENAHRTDYERTILYVSPSFLDIRTPGGCDLNRCFLDARTRHSDVLRPDPARMQELLSLLSRLENAGREDGFAREFYCRLLFLEFMVGLNRAALEQPAGTAGLSSGAGSGVPGRIGFASCFCGVTVFGRIRSGTCSGICFSICSSLCSGICFHIRTGSISCHSFRILLISCFCLSLGLRPARLAMGVLRDFAGQYLLITAFVMNVPFAFFLSADKDRFIAAFVVRVLCKAAGRLCLSLQCGRRHCQRADRAECHQNSQ